MDELHETFRAALMWICLGIIALTPLIPSLWGLWRLATVLMLLGCSRDVSDCSALTYYDKVLKVFSLEENRLAENRGYGVCVRLYTDSLRWAGLCVDREKFKECINNEIVRERLTKEEILRAPFSLAVCDDVSYEDVIGVLEIGERLGFGVKSAIYVGATSGERKSMCVVRRCSLPHLECGMSLDKKTLGHSLCVSMYSNGDIIVDDQHIDGCNGELFEETISRIMTEKGGGEDKMIVLMVDKDVAYSQVKMLLDGLSRSGRFLVHLAGVNKQGGLQSLVIGIPVPDGFFWSWSDDC